MSHTLIDIYNNILEYNGHSIHIIIDNHNIPWFSASNVTNLLEYSDKQQTIKINIDEHNRTTFDNLKDFVRNIPNRKVL